jgi:hypothetical protein
MVDLTDWYWIVGGTGNHIAEAGDPYTGDETQRFASARNGYVPATDAIYLAWQADKVSAAGFDPTTRIDTEENLAAVLLPYGITANFAPLTTG